MPVDHLLRTLLSLPEPAQDLSLIVSIQNPNEDITIAPTLEELATLLTSDSFSRRISDLNVECWLESDDEVVNSAVIRFFEELEIAYSTRVDIWDYRSQQDKDQQSARVSDVPLRYSHIVSTQPLIFSLFAAPIAQGLADRVSGSFNHLRSRLVTVHRLRAREKCQVEVWQ